MRSRQAILSVAAAAILSAGPVHAGPIIEFSTGAAGEGGYISWVGTDLWGWNIPIGSMTISDAARNNGTYTVIGPPWRPAGNLFFYTLDFQRYLGISGCVPDIPNLGFLDSNGDCLIEATLMSATIQGWNRALMAEGLRDAFGVVDVTHMELVRFIGQDPGWDFFGDVFATNELRPDTTFGTVDHSYIRNTPAVPEPGTMVLLGTGLVAAFRLRRRRRS